MVERTVQVARPGPAVFGKALSCTIGAIFLLLMPGIPWPGRLLVSGLLALAWLIAGARWAIRKYGRVAALALAGVAVATGGAAAYAHWKDGPNRQAAAQVRSLGAFHVGTTGTFLTGDVEYVYFDEKAGDEQVDQFTRLDGLGGLRRLVLKGTHITDTTARRLARFSGLRHLYLEGTGVSPATVDELRRGLPGCMIEVP
jgi:hypothetical protein